MNILDKIFETATRPFELFNSSFLIWYGYVFAVDGKELYTHHIYQSFQDIPLEVAIGIFVLLGVAQFVLTWRDSPNSNILSGFVLILSSLVWFLMTAAFSQAYPPLNMDMFACGLMCIASITSGKYLIDCNKKWKFKLEQLEKQPEK